MTAAPIAPAASLPLAELLASLSYALDMTEGQPPGHCIRACWIGTHIGQAIGLEGQALSDLYYTLLLKDLGCSSNAARIAELYLTDDRRFKHDFKFEDTGLAGALKFVFTHTGRDSDLASRLKAISHIMLNGSAVVHEMIATRCTRGADIARQLRFSEAVAAGIHSLDEHWDGTGHPARLTGEAIPLYARIALLSQVADVFLKSGGPDAAIAEVEARSGRWFDPALVAAFLDIARAPAFWEALGSETISAHIFRLPPALDRIRVDEDWLDDIVAAYGQVIDAKSPFTSGHSERVALFAEGMGLRLGLDAQRLRWLRRAAALHDVGKLGVSSRILEKPGKLSDEEWVEMRDHAVHSNTILSHVSVFGELAPIAAAHHERLDGKGYPLGLKGHEIPLETRIITVADFFDALTADRPYRPAMPLEKALGIIRAETGSAVDPDCFAALLDILPASALRSAA